MEDGAEPRLDPEIAAMQAMAGALDDLGDEARGRVLQWAAARYGIGTKSLERSGGQDEAPDQNGPTSEETADFASFYDMANPTTDSERALVGAYWLQVVEGATNVKAFDVNKELKNLGHGIGNITSAFSDLMGSKPNLVMQTQKSGSSRQARKTYKVTTAGIKQVKEMLSGESLSEGHE